MSYDFNEVERRLRTGEFRALALEALNYYEDADILFGADPDFPCTLIQMASDGIFPPMSRAQIRAFMSLLMAVSQRVIDGTAGVSRLPMEPATDNIDSPVEERPEGQRTEMPDVFKRALEGLDLENL